MRQVLPDLPAFEAERRIAEKCACLCIVGEQLPDAAGLASAEASSMDSRIKASGKFEPLGGRPA